MVKLQRIAAAFLLLLLGFALPALADPSIPPLTGRVMDLARVLDQRTVDALTRQLADHETATSNQVVVVTLSSLKDYTIEQWGRALLNGWGIGQRDKNNGVVLVVAPLERQLRIEVGYGLEYKLSNGAAADIIQNEIIPHFKDGDTKGGITAGVNAILQTITGTYRPSLSVERSTGTGTHLDLAGFAPFVAFPLLFIATVVINIVRGGRPVRRDRYYGNRYDDDGYGYNNYGNGFYLGNRDRSGSSRGSSGGGGGGGFSGGGGSGGGGGASGRW